MCGIAGIVATDCLAPDDWARAISMRDVMRYRGPDGAGLHVDEHAVLAHRRLSIVDLAGGHQPLSNENGAVWITYNGEIYNHRDVRAELEAAGHAYRTRSDTETIVHAYEEWGGDCVHRFRGMFAFALWDEHLTGDADHSQRLWALLMLELWFRECIDGDAAAEPLEYAVLLKAA